jgi:hypothetical protein
VDAEVRGNEGRGCGGKRFMSKYLVNLGDAFSDGAIAVIHSDRRSSLCRHRNFIGTDETRSMTSLPVEDWVQVLAVLAWSSLN